MEEMSLSDAVQVLREGLESLSENSLELINEFDEDIDTSDDPERKLNRNYDKRIMLQLEYLTKIINDLLRMVEAIGTKIDELEEE